MRTTHFSPPRHLVISSWVLIASIGSLHLSRIGIADQGTIAMSNKDGELERLARIRCLHYSSISRSIVMSSRISLLL